MTPPRRVGVFGGAFDPPHLAHAAVARAAVDQLRLDELRILPTGNAWHKATELSPPEHRLAMTRIAFTGVPRAVIDERELHRRGPTYTVDTLRELHAEQPDAELFLLMGEDQAAALTRWHDWRGVLALAVIGIAGRAATPGEVRSALPAEARSRQLVLPPMPESATAIRALVRSGAEIGHLVAPGVASYIERHRLYQSA
ncbi:nicotinate (nicotinamide) nucleotide adenylyltransferase [Ramlibacter sp.]|uniref:nicotinate (nicotinamide) nucleotide adenylyltransferase n=1 Tax=Ramlibacter sp. TaxID=1917967 RepID=UPI002CF33A92|nr:nicotinate (nicotinamide) nucleotide adenylyltransferase [Ramlibacter sp.]HWI80636.1 nicotinate (nicotinamide) nucleotide adenylyltransferase [Ramlibacter sp.]